MCDMTQETTPKTPDKKPKESKVLTPQEQDLLQDNPDWEKQFKKDMTEGVDEPSTVVTMSIEELEKLLPTRRRRR
jgi:hypothetical protein